MTKPAPAYIAIITFCLLLGGCGFHLKGMRNADQSALKELHIKGLNRYDDIAANVKQQAKAHNIKITTKADWSISLSDEIQDTWQASSTQSYTTNDYYLRILVTVNFHHKGDVYGPVTLVEEAIFQDNANESSSKSNERDILLEQLRQSLAESILQRVEHLAANPPACETHESQPATAQ